MSRRTTFHRSYLHSIYRSMPFVPVADGDWIVAAEDVSSAAVGDIFTLVASQGFLMPGMGRNVTAELTNVGASTLNMTIKVTGVDVGGQLITELISGLVDGGGVQTGSRCFKRILQVEIHSIEAGAGAANDLVDVGFGDRLGVDFNLGSLTNGEGRNKVTVFRNNSGTYVPLEGSSAVFDTVNQCLTAVGSGGSGAIAAGDQFEIVARLERDDPDDREFFSEPIQGQ